MNGEGWILSPWEGPSEWNLWPPTHLSGPLSTGAESAIKRRVIRHFKINNHIRKNIYYNRNICRLVNFILTCVEYFQMVVFFLSVSTTVTRQEITLLKLILFFFFLQELEFLFDFVLVELNLEHHRRLCKQVGDYREC